MNYRNNQSKWKGIILAGGNGSRLYPITKTVSKQLIPIYNKPMIYYPLCTLMNAEIRDFLIITKPDEKNLFENLLGDGSKFGINITYAVQKKPEGIAQSFLIGEHFIGSDNVALILGDNLFHGDNLLNKTKKAKKIKNGGSIFAYYVNDPNRYGVVDFDVEGNVISIEEKPINPPTNFAVTGLYFYDNSVLSKAKKVTPSKRGELEITEINQMYLNNGTLKVQILEPGTTWLDTGTFNSLHEASSYVKTIENRQGLKISCPEEVAWKNGWIKNEELEKLALPLLNSYYGKYLINLLS